MARFALGALLLLSVRAPAEAVESCAPGVMCRADDDEFAVLLQRSTAHKAQVREHSQESTTPLVWGADSNDEIWQMPVNGESFVSVAGSATRLAASTGWAGSWVWAADSQGALWRKQQASEGEWEPVPLEDKYGYGPKIATSVDIGISYAFVVGKQGEIWYIPMDLHRSWIPAESTAEPWKMASEGSNVMWAITTTGAVFMTPGPYSNEPIKAEGIGTFISCSTSRVWMVDSAKRVVYQNTTSNGQWTGIAGPSHNCVEVSEGSGYLFCVTADQLVFRRTFPADGDWEALTGSLKTIEVSQEDDRR